MCRKGIWRNEESVQCRVIVMDGNGRLFEGIAIPIPLYQAEKFNMSSREKEIR